MAWFPIAAAVVSTVISVAAAKKQADAQKNAAEYQAAVARNNAIAAEQYASHELARGQVEESTKRMETAQRMGAIRAAIAGSGFDPGGETPLRLTSDTASLGELDARTIRNNAERAAYGYRLRGSGYESDAGLSEMRGNQAQTAGQLGMWSSVISGAASVGDKWSKFKSVGASPYSNSDFDT